MAKSPLCPPYFFYFNDFFFTIKKELREKSGQLATNDIFEQKGEKMMNYTCKETCNMDKPCKNKHCSANPKYIPPKPKKEKK